MRAILLILLALTAGCASVARRDLVWIGVSGGDPCTVALDDKSYALPAEAPRLAAAARRLARRSEGALVGEVDVATTFTCWTSAIAALRDARFRRLGLASVHAAPE